MIWKHPEEHEQQDEQNGEHKTKQKKNDAEAVNEAQAHKKMFFRSFLCGLVSLLRDSTVKVGEFFLLPFFTNFYSHSFLFVSINFILSSKRSKE